MKTATYGKLTLKSSSVEGEKTILNLEQKRSTIYKTTTDADLILGGDGVVAKEIDTPLTGKFAVATATVKANGGVDKVMDIFNSKNICIKHSYYNKPQWEGHVAFFREGATAINGMYCKSSLVPEAEADSYVEPREVIQEITVTEEVAG